MIVVLAAVGVSWLQGEHGRERPEEEARRRGGKQRPEIGRKKCIGDRNVESTKVDWFRFSVGGISASCVGVVLDLFWTCSGLVLALLWHCSPFASSGCSLFSLNQITPHGT